LGVLWALWHFPLFWTGVWTPPTAANMVMFVVITTARTVVMAWVLNTAEGSLLITMLMHASFNTFANKIVVPLFPAPLLDTYGLLPVLVGFVAVAVILVAATRGRLSYRGDRRTQETDAGTVPRERAGLHPRQGGRRHLTDARARRLPDPVHHVLGAAVGSSPPRKRLRRRPV